MAYNKFQPFDQSIKAEKAFMVGEGKLAYLWTPVGTISGRNTLRVLAYEILAATDLTEKERKKIKKKK